MWLNDNSLFIPVVEPNMAEKRTLPRIADIESRIENYDAIEQT